jgi:ABC-type branched-subunit amino acid transport system substrate-binding protein
MKRFASAGARSRRGAGRLGQGVVTLGAALLASCYFVVDRKGDQCSTDGDCQDRGAEFATFTCDADQKLCINLGAQYKFLGKACTIDANCRDEGTTVNDLVVCDGRTCAYQPPANECQTNADCTQKAGGKPSLCRRPDRRCVLIESEDCAAGDPLDVFQNANAIVFGTLLTNRGPYAKDGLPIQNAVAMATTQIDQGLGGLPGGPKGGPQRPIAFVFCHEGDDTFRAARHLTDTLRVPAIIGASISDFTIEAASKVTIPSGVLLISPSATSISITDLPDNGLVWRTAPSDVVQSAALVELGESLQTTIDAQFEQAEKNKLRIAVVRGNDVYGQGLSSAFTSDMKFNGDDLEDLVNNKDVVLRDLADFPVEGDDEAQIQTKEKAIDDLNAAIVNLAPHIIVLIGSSDMATYIMDKVDSQLTAFPPYYLVADGAFGDTLLGVLEAGESRNLRQRVRITVPGTTGENFNAYLANYSELFTDDGKVFGAAGAYDATYLLALAASSLTPGDVTGPKLAAALFKTAYVFAPPDHVFDVKLASSAGRYFSLMASDNFVNFNGASGPLDFNGNGEATADIQIFCAGKANPGDPDALLQLQRTGRYYDAFAEKLEGTDACDPVLPLPPPTDARATP